MSIEIPSDMRAVFDAILEAEIKLSYGSCEAYNDFLLNGDNVSAVSASSRCMKGFQAVSEATVAVACNNNGERCRETELISFDATEKMAYFVFRTGAEIRDRKSGEYTRFGWIVTLILQNCDGEWKIVHRQNTRISN